MGYRSEVAILLNKKAVERMTDELKKTFEETFDTVRTLDDGCVLYHTKSYKWHDVYEEVAAINAFIEDLDEYDDAGAEFLRIGEEEDDIKHETYGEWDSHRLWVETYISLEGKNIEQEKGQQ